MSFTDSVKQIPKPVLIGLAVVIVLALILAARKGMAQAAAPAQPTGPQLDPNQLAMSQAMTAQADAAARASGFGTLASAIAGYSTALVGANRDLGVAADSANAAETADYFAANTSVLNTRTSEAGATARSRIQATATIAMSADMLTALEAEYAAEVEQTMLSESGQTARTGITTGGQVQEAAIQGQTQQAAIQGQTAIAGINSRTALGINQTNNDTQRQQQNAQAINQGIKTVCNGVVRFFTFGLAGC